MPSYPNHRNWNTISSRPFSKYAKSLEKMGTAKYPLHIGDTYLSPPESAHQSTKDFLDSGAHKYCPPKGHPALISAISEEYDVEPARVMVTPGATGGLHISAMSTLSPGDKVLILAPFWPLAKGILQAVGAIPVLVPFFGEQGSVRERLSPYITDDVVAIYCNSPNNPSGAMLTSDETEELAELVRANDWWLYADEVYERLIYDGQHMPIRHLAPNHTISIYSFSKAYGMAGYRCGYIILPNASLEEHFLKGMVHSFYSVPTNAQIVAARVLRTESAWIDRTCELYAEAGAAVAEILGVPTPTNGTFIFMDISEHLNNRTFDEFMEACIEEKLLLAPGSAFGTRYENHIRICFTCIDKNVAIEGAQVLKRIMLNH